MKQKSMYTVKEATSMAFQRMPLDFDAFRLVDTARRIMARPHCFDGTILRRLRELRDEKPELYNYKVVDTETGKYQKINPKIHPESFRGQKSKKEKEKVS